MLRIAVWMLIVAVVLLPVGALAQEAPPAPAETEESPATTSGPFDLYIFHSPGCPACQRVIALVPDMEKLSSQLRVVPVNNTVTGANEQAEALRKQALIQPEAWGISVAIYVGEGWITEEGKKLLGKIHELLKDRLEMIPQPWEGDNVAQVAAQRGEIEVMQELRSLRGGMMFRAGLRDSVRFQNLVLLLVLTGLLALLGGGFRRTALVGLGFWGGSALVFFTQGLGAFRGLAGALSYEIAAWGNLALALLLGLAVLAEARRRWLIYKATIQEDAALPAAEAASPAAPPAEQVAEPPSWAELAPTREPARGPALVGFLVGLVLTFLVVTLAPSAAVVVLGEAWRLGKVPAIVLSLLNPYLLGVLLSLFLLGLLALALTASDSLRRNARENPAELRLAAFLLFLVMGIYLIVQGLAFLLDRLMPPG